jgi:hypothetical protein
VVLVLPDLPPATLKLTDLFLRYRFQSRYQPVAARACCGRGSASKFR